jgi:hypothetical protein
MSRTPLLLAIAFLACACDNEPTKAQTLAKSAAPPTSASTPPPPPPPAPRAVLVTVDDSAAVFDSDRVEFAAPDVKGRLATALSGKKVEGETISVVAARETKMPKVAQVIAAVANAKPKGILVKTMKRDRSTVDLPLALGVNGPRAGCAAVGYIAKDSSSSTWPASGATATKYTKGMAGPDITRASDGLRKLVNACDATHFFVGSDEGVTWGLVADLAIAVLEPEDAGAASKAKQIVVVAKATPGRKLEEE